MRLSEKLRREAKAFDRRVRGSLEIGYDYQSAAMRDLLEQAASRIEHLELQVNLQRSVLANYETVESLRQ